MKKEEEKNISMDEKCQNVLLQFAITSKLEQISALYNEVLNYIEYCDVKGYRLPDEAWNFYTLAQRAYDSATNE